MCTSHPSNVYVYYPGSYEPRIGDLMVLANPAPYGHVGVVMGSGDPSVIRLLEQNADASGIGEYKYADAKCFITAGAPPSQDNVTCSGVSSGFYCGGHVVDGGAPNMLYFCFEGALASSTPCGVCIHADKSAKPPLEDECGRANCTGVPSGWYCGSNAVNGSDPDALFLCSNGVPVSAQHCTSGCAVESQGIPDRCL